MRIGVVGAGRFGKNHVRTLHEMGVLTAVADLDETVRTATTEAFGVPAYATHADLVLHGIDAAVVATPAHVHYPVAKELLAQGIPCLVEKPLTLDLAEAEELVAIAKSSGVALMVGHLLLYQPAIQFLKTAIVEAQIGDLVSLHQERLNLGKARNQENALWSLGVHDVAVALFLVGTAPSHSSAYGTSTFTPGVADDTYLHMTFPSGTQAHIHSSWLWPEQRRRLTLIGTKGMFVFDEPAKTVTLVRKSIDAQLNNIDEGSEVVFEGDSQPLRLELEHFVECVKTGANPYSDGHSGVQVLQVLANSKL